MTTLTCQIPPYFPFAKGGIMPFCGKEGGRGDLLINVNSSFETLNI